LQQTKDRRALVLGGGEAARWGLFILLCLLTGLQLALTIRLIETQSILSALACLGKAHLWYTALLLALLCAFFGFLFHSLFAGGALTIIPVAILAFVNYFKVALTSTPLQFSDLALAGRVGKIAAMNAASLRLSAVGAGAILWLILWSALLFFLSRRVRLEWRRSAPAALAPAGLLLVLFWIALDPLVLRPLGAPIVQAFMDQSIVNSTCGVPLGLLRGAKLASESGKEAGPDQEALGSMLEVDLSTPAPTAAPVERKKPNIIFFLSESFFDVTQLPGVTFSEDPLEEYRALQAEGVSGDFMSRTLGYGTCNIELEALTGINTYLFAYEDLYTIDPARIASVPSVVQLLKDAGYRTTMLHTFNDEIYHRTPILEAIGFDEIYFNDKFAAIDPDAAAAPDYWTYMAGHLSGGAYSDDYLTSLIMDLDQQTGDAPLFTFAISVENHSPHNGEKYDDYTVEVTSDLTGYAAGVLDSAVQGVDNASAALKRLTDYFREQDEPTVIIFFGDHRPGLGLEDGLHSVYSALGMCDDNSGTTWTMDQKLELLTTTYLIWSNDPDYLPAPAGTVVPNSSNYLGLSILDAAGVDKPLYWQLLEQFSQDRLMDTYLYQIGRDGTVGPATGEAAQRQERLAAFLEDAVHGEQHVTQQLWQYPGRDDEKASGSP